MNNTDIICIQVNGSYRNVTRLFKMGFTESEITLKYLEKNFEKLEPRRFDRLKTLYSDIFRNKLFKYSEHPEKRKSVKEQFYKKWKEMNLPFSELIIDQMWENIAKEVYLI